MGTSLKTILGDEINYCPECGKPVKEVESPYGPGFHYRIECPVFTSKRGDWARHLSEASLRKMESNFNPISGERNA